MLVDVDGRQVGSFVLETEAFGGGGWLDADEEVLEVESGSVQMLITPAVGDEDPKGLGGTILSADRPEGPSRPS